jgi:hypothetical protein
MRDPNLGTVAYAAADPTGITTLPDMVRFLRDREIRLEAAIKALAAGHIDKMGTAPLRPRDGDIRYADGIGWNPGGGAGIYYFDGSVWNQMG